MKKIILALLTAGLFTACHVNDTVEHSSDTHRDSAVHAADKPADAFGDSSATALRDNDFAMAAADGGMAEVEFSRLAQNKGTAASVKDLANMMVKDHTAANNELKAMATKMGLSLPTALSERNKQKHDNLSNMSGAEFDEAYTDIMLKDHNATIALFEGQASGGMNAEMKAWAAGKLPALKHHLEMVNSAKAGLRK